ncbi:molecular chaperone DnaK [Candidatus Micrarchaeota archaeon]|nr:molecular chaperone DnaK [Candidatus Micrarchaeota archaeon]
MIEKILGIDLGTSNSAASVLDAGRPMIIPAAEGTTIGGKAFPSYVAFTKEGDMLVGEPARRQMVTNPDGTVYAAKRKIGSDFIYSIRGKTYTPQQISAFLLQKIKKDAEAFLGVPVRKAVITVPAYFNDNQRQATKDAGTIAGLEVVRIINEPTAASLAFGLDKGDKEELILVFDFGGGTLDVTVMEFGKGVFEVKSTSGDTQLGGTDMDNVLIEYVAQEFSKKEGADLRQDGTAMTRLREAVEKAKMELSTTTSTDINLPFITSVGGKPRHLQLPLSRAKLEQLVRPIVERCRNPLHRALSDAKLEATDINRVILVGGPTRMPLVQQFVEEELGKKIERGVDPMECVASGAAIQAGVLAGEVKDVLLLDVTPLSLGIETLGGVFTKIIGRNTTIPTKHSQVFSTAADMQTAVDIHVLQGERAMSKDNVELGHFQLVGIPPAPRGIPQVEVAFDIDANGILHVLAKDKGTGKEQKIQITAPHKLPKSDVERMMKEAEQFASQDQKRKADVDVINEADAIAYSAEQMLEQFKDKISAEQKTKITEEAASIRKLIAEKNTEALKPKVDEIKKLVQSIGASFYQPQQEPHTPPKGNGSEKIVDAEYSVEDEEKKD